MHDYFNSVGVCWSKCKDLFGLVFQTLAFINIDSPIFGIILFSIPATRLDPHPDAVEAKYQKNVHNNETVSSQVKNYCFSVS